MTPINRRTLTFSVLAALAAAPAASALAAAPAAPAAVDFSGVWQVDRHGPPGSGGPGGRRPGFGPGGGPRGGPPEGGPEGGGDARGLDNGDRHVRSMMTAAGRAAFDSMDLAQHPTNNCQSPGLPSIAMTPNLQVWSQTGDEITIHHEYFDTLRDVKLIASAPAGPVRQGGYTVGKVEGRTLTITTTGDAGHIGGLGRNAPSSDERVVVERYTLSADGQSMTGQMIIRDPKYLNGQLVLPLALTRAPAGTTMEIFPCDIEASHYDLPAS